ncbi:hypothetical protein OBK01_13530 [Empedobacter falsenii]
MILRNKKIIENILIIAVVIFCIFFTNKMNHIEENEKIRIELLTDQNKSYKTILESKNLGENEIKKHENIILICQSKLDKLEPISNNNYLFFLIIILGLFIFYVSLNKLYPENKRRTT